MLYVFRSKAAADLIMLEAVGDQLLRILGRAPAPSGIIETAALPAAIQALEAAVADERNRSGQGGDAEEDQKEKRVGLAQRAWPMLEMMKRAVAEKADISIRQEPGSLIQLAAGARLSDVVKALNSLGATPQDLLAILQAMKSAGALNAELEVI